MEEHSSRRKHDPRRTIMRANIMTPELINATFAVAYLAVWTFIGGVLIRGNLT